MCVCVCVSVCVNNIGKGSPFIFYLQSVPIYWLMAICPHIFFIGKVSPYIFYWQSVPVYFLLAKCPHIFFIGKVSQYIFYWQSVPIYFYPLGYFLLRNILSHTALEFFFFFFSFSFLPFVCLFFLFLLQARHGTFRRYFKYLFVIRQ
jgi:hypothetical protein